MALEFARPPIGTFLERLTRWTQHDGRPHETLSTEKSVRKKKKFSTNFEIFCFTRFSGPFVFTEAAYMDRERNQ